MKTFFVKHKQIIFKWLKFTIGFLFLSFLFCGMVLYECFKVKNSKVAKADELTNITYISTYHYDSLLGYRGSYNGSRTLYYSMNTAYYITISGTDNQNANVSVTFLTYNGDNFTGTYNYTRTINITGSIASPVEYSVPMQFASGMSAPDTISTRYDYFNLNTTHLRFFGFSNGLGVSDIYYYQYLNTSDVYLGKLYMFRTYFYYNSEDILVCSVSVPVTTIDQSYYDSPKFYIGDLTTESSYSYGYSMGYNQGQEDKIQYGNDRYQQGYYAGIESGSNLGNMILSVAEVPFGVISSMLDFNLLGVNISTFVKSLLTMALVIWLIKFFI